MDHQISVIQLRNSEDVSCMFLINEKTNFVETGSNRVSQIEAVDLFLSHSSTVAQVEIRFTRSGLVVLSLTRDIFGLKTLQTLKTSGCP